MRRAGSLADEITGGEDVAGGAGGLSHLTIFEDHGAFCAGAHWIANDGIGPGARRDAREGRVPSDDGDCFQIATTHGSHWAMRGELAFDSGFVTIGAAGGIASVIAWGAHDALDEGSRIRVVMVRATRAFRANGTRGHVARNIAHDGRAAAR